MSFFQYDYEYDYDYEYEYDYDYENKWISTVSNINLYLLNPVIYSGSFNTNIDTIARVSLMILSLFTNLKIFPLV